METKPNPITAGIPVFDPRSHSRLRRIGGERLLVRMCELFRQNVPERMAALREASAQQNLDAVGSAAHAIRSSAGNLGATALYEAASRVEVCAVERSTNALEVEISRMENALTAAMEAVSNLLLEIGEGSEP